MTIQAILADARPVRTIPFGELKTMVETLKNLKFWAGPWFALSTELHRRAVNAWRHEDIFGGTR